MAHHATMREMLLLAIGLLAFIGAAFVPGGALDSASSEASEIAESESAAPSADMPRTASARSAAFAAWNAGTVALPRAPDGHFYAQANVNGMPLGFLVDTGASMIALTGPDAEAIGLYWSPADIRVVAQGASGPVRGVQVILDEVELNGHVARDIRAVVIPEGLGISLLGQSFLATIDPVRIEGDRMMLGD